MTGSTQAQRDYISDMLNRIGVEAAYQAGAITCDMAVNQGFGGGFRTPREAARHCHSKQVASQTISALRELQ